MDTSVAEVKLDHRCQLRIRLTSCAHRRTQSKARQPFPTSSSKVAHGFLTYLASNSENCVWTLDELARLTVGLDRFSSKASGRMCGFPSSLQMRLPHCLQDVRFPVLVADAAAALLALFQRAVRERWLLPAFSKYCSIVQCANSCHVSLFKSLHCPFCGFGFSFSGEKPLGEGRLWQPRRLNIRSKAEHLDKTFEMLRFIFTWLVFIVLLAQGAVALETQWGCQALSSDAFGGYFEGAVWQDLRLLLSFVMGIACVHTGEVLIKNGGPNVMQMFQRRAGSCIPLCSELQAWECQPLFPGMRLEAENSCALGCTG
eukprot:s1796_g10.t2